MSEYRKIMQAELKVDIYTGEECNQHESYWNIYVEGDKEADNAESDLIFSTKLFKPGTKITVECPVCPKCEQLSETCKCGFDWKKWIENKYA